MPFSKFATFWFEMYAFFGLKSMLSMSRYRFAPQFAPFSCIKLNKAVVLMETMPTQT